MSEVATTDESIESQDSEETPEVPATPAVDEATWKKRLAGKDQALTATKQKAAELQAQLDALSQWKAEKENADLTELQKLQKRLAELESSEATAKAEARAAKLARQFPLAADLLGDELSAFDEARVAEINVRLSQAVAGESEQPEPRVDPNTPRKAPPQAPKSDLKSLKEALTAIGNPFFDETA